MTLPIFTHWGEREREAFVSRLGSGIVRPITIGTLRRWRARARQGDRPYAEFIADLNRRVRDAWTPKGGTS